MGNTGLISSTVSLTHMSLSHRPRGNFKKILAKSADELEGEYLKLLDKAAMLRQMRQRSSGSLGCVSVL